MTDASLGHSLRAGLGALLLCAVAGDAARAAGESAPLAPHRAVYELTLSNSRGGSSMTSVAGRMVYDLTGSTCEGYTQKMRFVTRMTNQSGSASVSDLRSTTWEDAAGKQFRFDSTQARDDKTSETTSGEATRLSTSEGVKVEITKPGKRTLSVPVGTHFPVQHTLALLQAAKAGKTSFRADLYDGSEKGEKVYDTVSAVGRVQTAGGNRKLAQVAGTDRLNAMQAWPVSIAYFEPGSEGRDALPVYEISFLMFENGVSRRLHIDYGDFALQGELTEITFHEPSKCDRK
jgi:hypothetical protein